MRWCTVCVHAEPVWLRMLMQQARLPFRWCLLYLFCDFQFNLVLFTSLSLFFSLSFSQYFSYVTVSFGFGYRIERKIKIKNVWKKTAKWFSLNWKRMQTNKMKQSKVDESSENVIHCECKHKQISFGILNQGARNSCCRHAKKIQSNRMHVANTKIQFHHLSNSVVNTFRMMTFCHLTYVHRVQ